MTRIRRHLTYANVAATLALVIAIAGGGTAIARSGKNSVRSSDVKNGQITARDLAPLRAVTETGTVQDAASDGQASYGTVIATCPKGQKLLSGGAPNTPTIGLLTLVSSSPAGNAWRVVVASDSGDTKPIAATALCLSAKPG